MGNTKLFFPSLGRPDKSEVHRCVEIVTGAGSALGASVSGTPSKAPSTKRLASEALTLEPGFAKKAKESGK